jgi:hypothetical protein
VKDGSDDDNDARLKDTVAVACVGCDRDPIGI